jgi:aminocarboxymuconate-semialdehyde decarboxylase
MTGGPAACARAVDVHVHAVPRSLVDRAARERAAGVELVRDGSSPVLGFPGTAPAPPMPAAMLSPAALAAAAEGQHVATQLLAPWTDLLGYTLPERVAADWSRAYNAALAEACAESPRQVPMATIPLAHPRRAAAELAAARELGCRGVIVGTDVPGLHLGSPELEPVWEAAAGLAMPVLLHPTYLELLRELHGAGLKNAVGRAGPTAVALARLLYSGALLRHPSLSVVACHGGGAFAAVAPRIVRNHELGWSGSASDVGESIGRLHFDSVVLDPRYLRYLVSVFGADRLLLGSDLPFPWEEDPLGTVARAALTPDEHDAVVGANARRLYGLAEGAPCARCAGS